MSSYSFIPPIPDNPMPSRLYEEILESEETDLVNSPSHYTQGSVECADVIEDAIKGAPKSIYGFAHSNALKYLLRLWYKEDPLRDAKKAKWYLERLISKLEQEVD